MNIDEIVFRVMASVRSPGLNRITTDFTSLGSTTLLTIQAIIAGVLLILVAHNQRAVWRVGVALGGTELWTEIIKVTVRRARPTTILPLVNATAFSFPSGHAANSTAFYFTLALALKPYLDRRARVAVRTITVILIIAIAVSRVYLGVHFASDVAGGILLGLVWSWTSGRLLTAFADRGKRPVE